MRRVLFSLLVLFAAMAVGCAEDEVGYGSIQVKWLIQGTQCGPAGIKLIRVDLKQSGTTILSEPGDCGNGKLLLENVPEGVYDIQLTGLNDNSKGIYEGYYPNFKVRAGSTPNVTPSIPVTVKTGELALMWILPTAKPCSGNNIAQVETTLWRGSVAERTVTFSCDPGSATPSDQEAAAWLDAQVDFTDGYMVFRNLVPGEMKVNLFGISSEGLRTAYGEETVEVPIDNDVKVDVQLTACQDPCQ